MEHEDLIRKLEDGPAYRLAEIRDNAHPPSGPPGIYTLWCHDCFIYVGISYRDAADAGNPQAGGLRGRLRTHAKARRNVALSVMLEDRFVTPAYTPQDLAALREGRLDVRERLREVVGQIHYRAVVAPGPVARTVEDHIRTHGLPSGGLHFLNPKR